MDGCGTADDDGGARVVSSAEKKKHLIEAAPFGHLDQMLITIVYGGVWGGFAPLSRNLGSGGQRPPPKPKILAIQGLISYSEHFLTNICTVDRVAAILLFRNL